ncbi:hypothetical protein F4604DRAFT_1787223 [Suillus subluteus]|nr:hypothetical protein F4604DRAFT_1787223 [Suillus subluteus]
MIGYAGDFIFLSSMTWILSTVWEVLALCLAVWITVNNFHEMRRHSTRGIIGDVFLAISCFQIGFFSSTLSGMPICH